MAVKLWCKCLQGSVKFLLQEPLLASCRFPATAAKKDTSFYCKFNDKTLQAYSAVMHFTGAVASLFAGYVTQRYGRTTSMIVAGTSYIAGSVLQVLP